MSYNFKFWTLSSDLLTFFFVVRAKRCHLVKHTDRHSYLYVHIYYILLQFESIQLINGFDQNKKKSFAFYLSSIIINIYITVNVK